MFDVTCDTALGDQQANASPSFCEPQAIDAFAASCVVASFTLLALGFLYYVCCRDQIPALLILLGMRPHMLPGLVTPAQFFGSLPSFIHVAAFSLLVCAFFRPSLLLALAMSASWLSVNILWELSCANHQAWFRILYSHAGLAGPPLRCTYDTYDIAAACIGAAAAPLLAWFFVRKPSGACSAE